MKQLLMKALFCLSSLLSIYSSYGQNHYIQANSVAGVEVRQGGGENSICPTYSSHFSTNQTSDKFYFTSMVCQAAYVKLEIFNPTAGTIKATLTTTYGATVETKTIAANSSSGELVIPYPASYNWKFESVATPPAFITDTVRAVVNVNKYVFPKLNDIAVPANTNYRLKSGQTLSSGTLTSENTDNAFLFRPTAIGTQTVILELYNASTNAIVGESNLVVIVTQNCALAISSITQFDSKNYDIAITYNQIVDPYKYEIYNSAALKLKTGTTNGDGNPGLKRIFIDDLPSGIYDLKLSSLNSNCGVVSKSFSYGNTSDVCVMNATATRAGNIYNVTIAPITGVSGIYYTLTNALDSVITEGIINSGLPLSLNFLNQKEGQYFLSLTPANSTKICFQKLSLPWVIAPTVNNRGYLKKYNNVPDYYEMAGLGDYGGVKDAGTGWVVKETRNVMLWQTYVKSLSNSVGAKALITFRQDSSSTSKHYSLCFEKGKVKLISRTTKGGQNIISNETVVTLDQGWLRFERNGNNLIAKISDSPPESNNPNFSTSATINNAFVGWNLPFWKGLYVSSGSSTTLATAEFHRFLGGPYTGTTAAADNTPLAPPIITASNLNPMANASVTFTSNACKSGYLIQFYKNGLPSFQGLTYVVNAVFGDSYKARCEKGAEKSGFSNTINFTAPSTGQICGIDDNLKLGVKISGTTAYNIYARIFNGKLWVTQSLGTNPESFLVRGVNLLNATFDKTWTGTDYSCFEGQNTGFGGFVEPVGFVTPAGYSLSTTADGAKIYSLTIGGNSTNSITASPSSGVTISEPAIVSTQPYYFTNGQPKSYYVNADGSFTNNLPVIYRSNTRNVSNYNVPTARPVHPTIKMQAGYSMTNDLVWLQNNKVKFGINLLRGGQIAWASVINATANLVYNGYDGGFQVTLDAYQKKDGYMQNGKYSRAQHSDIYQFNNTLPPKNPDGSPAPNPNNIPNLTSYNTTMGGDFNNNSQSLIYHYRDGNSYIVAVRPIFYTIDSEFSEVIIETKYTLEPGAISLRVEHKYISKRTDGQYDNSGFDGAAAPACFLVNSLSKYRTHQGDNLIEGNLPVQNYGEPIIGTQTNKKYLCVYNPSSTAALGIYKVAVGSQYANLKQSEVNGSVGTEFAGGYTYVHFFEDFIQSGSGLTLNRNDFQKTMISYIMVGNHPDEIDTEAQRLKVLNNN